MKKSIWDSVKAVLSSQYFKDAAETFLISLLKLQTMGGIKGWLLKTLAKNFSKEVIHVTFEVFDYVDIKNKMEETASMEDRNEATDRLNDLMR